MNRADTIAFLEKVGIDPIAFDNPRGTLADLVKEQRLGEAKVLISGFSGKPATLRSSSRVTIQTPKEYLRELYRIRRGVKVVRHVSEFPGLNIPVGWAGSETSTANETPEETMMKAFRQEFGVDLRCPERSRPQSIMRQMLPEAEFAALSPDSIKPIDSNVYLDIHDSSVYQGFDSMCLTRWFELNLEERRGPDSFFVRDGPHTVNFLVWERF